MGRKASIIMSAVIAIIIGLWVWTGVTPKNAMSIGGSTSVDPIMQRLTNKYRETNKEGNFVYSSSGSRGGVSNTESGTYKMGFISKAIDEELSKKSNSQELINNVAGINLESLEGKDLQEKSDTVYNYLINVKKYANSNNESGKFDYYQIAQDAIILTYHAPKDFTENFGKYFDLTVNRNSNGTYEPSEFTKKVMKMIYAKEATWFKIAQSIVESSEQSDVDDMLKGKDIKDILISKDDYELITPFSRETGSGTRNSFESMFGIKPDKDHLVPSKSTEFNSNGMMFTSLQPAMNSFGYLSMNYLGSIIEDKNLSTVSINKFDPSNKENTIDDFKKDYTLTRPYIGVFKNNLEDKELRKIADFITWMTVSATDHNSEQGKLYDIEGLIPDFKINFEIKLN